MLDFQQKRKFKKVIYSRIMILALFIFIIFIAHSTYEIYNKEKTSESNLQAVKKNYSDLNQRGAILEAEISKLQTEAGVEEDIREKFNVAKPGETVIVVVNNASSTINDSGSEDGLWQKFLNWFK